MKQIYLVESIGLAVSAVLISISAEFVFQFIFEWKLAAMLTVTLLAILYLAYLFKKSSLGAGKVILLSVCCVIVLSAISIVTTLNGMIVLVAALIWLVRTLLYYPKILPACLDGLLCLLSLGLAGRVVETGHGMVMGVWVFFLIQSLWVLIPRLMAKGYREGYKDEQNQCRFNRAFKTAEAAISLLKKEQV